MAQSQSQAQSQAQSQEQSQAQSQAHSQAQPQAQPQAQSHTNIKTIDWYEMNDNLKRLGEERTQHWKRQDEQYAKIESIQSKIKDLNNQLNDEMKLLRTLLDKSSALYGLDVSVGNVVNNRGNLTKS